MHTGRLRLCVSFPMPTSLQLCHPGSPTHTCGCPTRKGGSGWPLESQRGPARGDSLSHGGGWLCGLFVPSLPSVSSIFSSWPVGQETFVEGAREKADWVCVCVCARARARARACAPPLWGIQTPADSQRQIRSLAWGREARPSTSVMMKMMVRMMVMAASTY